IGGFAVTAGIGVAERVAEFRKNGDDYSGILLEALADRLAEAFAEKLHRDVRVLWGIEPEAPLTNDQLIAEDFRGIRPAPGYPACPDHTEKQLLFQLMDTQDQIGVELTESMMMVPGSSVCGYYIAHPDAGYFAVGRIGADQVADYARRKQCSVAYVEKWLSPHLAYKT
ncbi:MAG: vitamin B12 dependent-methionine synthase activation domain-containing protein, partial [Armatimonadaceae bacterium]